MSRDRVQAASPAATRIIQLVAGIICMVMIANLQYGWTLFVLPIDNKFHWGRPSIQVAFTIFVLAETWLVQSKAGWLTDSDRGSSYSSAACSSPSPGRSTRSPTR